VELQNLMGRLQTKLTSMISEIYYSEEMCSDPDTIRTCDPQFGSPLHSYTQN